MNTRLRSRGDVRLKYGYGHRAALLLFCSVLVGCSSTPTPALLPSQYSSSSSVISTETQTLSPEEISRVADTSIDSAYELGPSDVIAVSVYLHPELNVPSQNSGVSVSGNSTETVSGALITGDGTVQLPLIGSVQIGGLTLAEAQNMLVDAYSRYVRDPKVSIQLTQANSLRYYLLGAFSQPGIKYPIRQLTLLEALALGGTVNIPQADLYQAYVAQGNVKLPIDMHALLIDGDMTQNMPLASGDTIVIPTNANENAFVFGTVTKPGAVQFQSDGLSLLQALSNAGLDLASLTDAQMSNIHIIRSEGRSAQFIIVDATKTLRGKAPSFPLQPGDIVYVPPTGVASWNEVVQQILPSLQTVSDILNPFVQIKFLQQKN